MRTIMLMSLGFILACALGVSPLHAAQSTAEHEGEPTIDGQLWVVNKRGDNLSVIDIDKRKIIATLPTGQGPHELAIDSAARYAVVTDYVGGNSLTVFDIPSLTVERTISLARYPKPHGIVYLPDQQRVAVSSEGSDSALVVNVHNGEIESAIDTQAQGSHMVAVPASGNVIYTSNMASNSVSILNVQAQALTQHLAMPATPEAITVNADSDTLWVGSNKDGWLSVYAVSDAKLLARWTDYTWPYRVLYSPNETYVVVPDLRQNTLDIFLSETLTRIQRIALPAGVSPKGLAFHPNAEIVFLSLYDANEVAVIDIPSGEILFRLPTGDGPDGIGYVPEQ